MDSMDTTKEDEKYYGLSRYNDYYVHFSNKNAIPIEEVDEIFCQFPGMKRSSQTGDATGLCFVNFKSEDDVKRVVKAMKNHEKIELREVDLIRRQQHGEQTNKTKGTKDGWAGWNANDSKRQQTRETEQRTARSSRSSESSSPSEPTETVIVELAEKKNKFMTNQNNDTIANGAGALKDQEEATATSELVDVNETDVVPLDMPELVPAKRKYVGENGSARVIGNKFTSPIATKPQTVIEAQEVIVVNVHESLGSPFILHLFEEYQPIAITSMKILPERLVRYCSVYFKTIKQAEAVQIKFNNISLVNKNLIVLTTNSLTSFAT